MAKHWTGLATAISLPLLVGLIGAVVINVSRQADVWRPGYLHGLAIGVATAAAGIVVLFCILRRF